MYQAVFINMLVHKNGNSRDTVLWSSSFADFLFLQNSKSRDAMWSSSFVEFPVFVESANLEIPCCEVPVLLIFCFCKLTANPEMPCGEVPVLLNFQFLQNQQIQRCHVVTFQFCWISSFCRISNAVWWSYSYGIRADITVQICKLAELAKHKQNQEINKTGTLSHGVSEVTIASKIPEKRINNLKSLQFSEVRNSTKHTLFTYNVQDF